MGYSPVRPAHEQSRQAAREVALEMELPRAERLEARVLPVLVAVLVGVFVLLLHSAALGQGQRKGGLVGLNFRDSSSAQLLGLITLHPLSELSPDTGTSKRV